MDVAYEDVFWAETDYGRRLVTKSLAPGVNVYGEKHVHVNGVEYRTWDPYRSKLSAAIYNGLRTMPIKKGQQILYLGASSGTTPSHVADIVDNDGTVYCVEFAQRMVRELMTTCQHRKNMLPILADANQPEQYAAIVPEVDVVYMDISQPNQAEIIIKNMDAFLKKGGYGMLMVKAMSIDMTANPKDIFRQEADLLEKAGYKILEIKSLEPYEGDHAAIVVQKT